MAKKYDYNRSIAVLRGLVTLSSLAYFVSLLAFVAFLAINFLPFLNHLIDFTEVEYVVSKIFLRLDAFLIIGFVLSLIGFFLCATMIKSLNREKGGFKALLLLVSSILFIVFFVIIKTKDLTLSYLLNYIFGGLLVVGIFGIALALFVLFLRIKSRREIEKKIRRYERNYMKFEKYNPTDSVKILIGVLFFFVIKPPW